jgi:hypothetical protein
MEGAEYIKDNNKEMRWRSAEGLMKEQNNRPLSKSAEPNDTKNLFSIFYSTSTDHAGSNSKVALRGVEMYLDRPPENAALIRAVE